MDEREPRVSFIMPAYNAAPYIGAALDSLFAQTFRRFEAIVANDGSPDTPELERVLAPYLPGIVYLKLEKNAGISAARNAAIRVAKGDLLAFLDCDDGIEPIYLEKQVAAFDADPGLDLVWCDSRLNGRPGYDGRLYSEFMPTKRPVTPEGLLLQQCSPVCSCVVVRRKAVLEVGGFDENFRRSEDFDLWLRLARAGKKFDYQPLVLGRRKERDDSLSADFLAQAAAALAVLRKFEASLDAGDPLLPIVVQRVREITADGNHELARVAMERGDTEDALHYYRLANAGRRTLPRSVMTTALSISPALALAMRSFNRRLNLGWRELRHRTGSAG